MRRFWQCIILIAACVLLGSTQVFAHAVLVRSDPPANSALPEAPATISIWFTEPLEADFSRITLHDAQGQAVETPPSFVSPDDPMRLVLEPGDLPDGVYMVSWRVLSAADGHATLGTFAFSVGAGEGMLDALNSDAVDVPIDGTIVRSLNILSLSLLVGGLGFWLLVWTPAGFDAQPPIERRMSRLIWVGWLFVGVTGILYLLLNASIAAGVSLLQAAADPSFTTFLTDTRYGLLWMLRMELWLGLGVTLVLARSRRWLWLALGLGVAILLVHSLYSHASVAPDAGAAVAGDWLHLLMTALWLGGLIQFFNVLWGALRHHPPADVGRLVAQFSNYARVALAALAVTGLYAAWLQVGSLEALFGTIYGRALLVKLVLFAPLLLVAFVNFMYTYRGLRQGQTIWIGRLRGLIGVEIALIVGMVVTVGVMTSVNPARQALVRQPEPVETPGYAEDQVSNGLRVQMAIHPGIVGENTFTVRLTDADGIAVTNATLVRLRFLIESQNLGESDIRLEAQPDGSYSGTGLNLSAPGVWRIRTTIQRPDAFDTVIDFEPDIASAPPPPAPLPNPPVSLADRTLALLLTGMVALIIGGFFAGRNQAPLWRGMGLLATSMVVVGMLFLVTGVLTAA